MPTLAHLGPDMVDRPWGVVGWLMPLLMLLLVAGVTVWAVSRLTSQRRPAVAGPAAPPTHPTPSDAAVERARVRYASGEMTREEFVRLSRDLGAPVDGEETSDG